jgi:hypothetical protein
MIDYYPQENVTGRNLEIKSSARRGQILLRALPGPRRYSA